MYPNASGFDPSLFHDDNGRRWVVSVHWDARPDRPSFAGSILQEYDVIRRQLVGPVRTLLQRNHLIAGPNLYKIDGVYYLMVAQHGTGWLHAIGMARSVPTGGAL